NLERFRLSRLIAFRHIELCERRTKILRSIAEIWRARPKPRARDTHSVFGHERFATFILQGDNADLYVQQSPSVVIDFERVCTTEINRDCRTRIDKEFSPGRPDDGVYFSASEGDAVFLFARLNQSYPRVRLEHHLANAAVPDLCAGRFICYQPFADRHPVFVIDLPFADYRQSFNPGYLPGLRLDSHNLLIRLRTSQIDPEGQTTGHEQHDSAHYSKSERWNCP